MFFTEQLVLKLTSLFYNQATEFIFELVALDAYHQFFKVKICCLFLYHKIIYYIIFLYASSEVGLVFKVLFLKINCITLMEKYFHITCNTTCYRYYTIFVSSITKQHHTLLLD